MSDWFQWTVIAFVILSITWHVFRTGAANPESTGKLGRKVNGLAAQVSALSGRTATQVSAMSERIGQVEAQMTELRQVSATSKDVQALEKLVDEKCNSLRSEIDGHKEISQQTNRNVQRIYDIMLNKGLGGQ